MHVQPAVRYIMQAGHPPVLGALRDQSHAREGEEERERQQERGRLASLDDRPSVSFTKMGPADGPHRRWGSIARGMVPPRLIIAELPGSPRGRARARR